MCAATRQRAFSQSSRAEGLGGSSHQIHPYPADLGFPQAGRQGTPLPCSRGVQQKVGAQLSKFFTYCTREPFFPLASRDKQRGSSQAPPQCQPLRHNERQSSDAKLRIIKNASGVGSSQWPRLGERAVAYISCARGKVGLEPARGGGLSREGF